MRASFRRGVSVGILMATIGAIAIAEEVINGQNTSHPVCVDGLPTNIEWGNTRSLGFISGSLYQAGLEDPLLNSASTGVIARDDNRQNNDTDLYMVFAFARRTFLGFAPNAFIADMEFPICVGNTNFPNFKLLLRGGSSPTYPQMLADYNGDGIGDGPASAIGFRAAFGLAPTPNVPLGSVLVVELGMPLVLPPGFGPGFNPVGQDGVYKPDQTLWKIRAATNTGLGEQSEMFVTVFPDGRTRLNNDHVPMRLEVDIIPGERPNVINRQKRYYEVGLITNDSLDTTTVDWQTMRFYDAALPGRLLPASTRFADLNGDDRMDQVIKFDMVSAVNAFNRNTTVMTVRGFTFDGDPVAGTDSVLVKN
ncbi:MAG TPA: hypothetical protein PKA27_00725 [Fimbriimonadaceae bacterium]|nr:hypothetical protein [Fimbriimonadaceae bacterium]